MYFNQNAWQGILAAADWAGQFPPHYFPNMSRLERYAWEKAARRREKIVTLESVTTLGPWRQQFTKRVICSTQFGFRKVSSSTDPMCRGPHEYLMGPTEAFQTISDLEGRLAKKRATLASHASAPAYNLAQSTVVSVAVELVELAKTLKQAVDAAYEWYGINYWLATEDREKKPILSY